MMNRTGTLYGLGAAILFGLSTPLAKLLLPDAGPLLLASLLYLGAGVGLSAFSLLRRRVHLEREAPLRRADLGWLAGIVLSGGLLGPVLLLIGLGRVSAATVSLLLNLEAPFTLLLAVAFFGEHLGRREAGAALIIVLGAALLGKGPGPIRADVLGVGCVAGACLFWALDNNFTQRLSLRDPVALVRIKGLAAGTLTLVLALSTGARLPRSAFIALALLLGVASYGASIVLYIHAVRALGVARQAAIFAGAPFVGVLGAVLIVGERLTGLQVVAMAIIVAGMTVLVRSRHAHLHVHDEQEHDHLHVHDEHHRHDHAGAVTGPHAHLHRHAPLVHDHPHTPDPHHRHDHP